MISIDFLKSRMEKAAILFPFLNISYDYIDNTHVIDIDTNLLKDNDPYFDFELTFLKDFSSEFPEDDLIFITSKDDRNLFHASGKNIFNHKPFESNEYKALIQKNTFDFYKYTDLSTLKSEKSKSFTNILNSYLKESNKDSKALDFGITFLLDEINKEAA